MCHRSINYERFIQLTRLMIIIKPYNCIPRIWPGYTDQILYNKLCYYEIISICMPIKFIIKQMVSLWSILFMQFTLFVRHPFLLYSSSHFSPIFPTCLINGKLNKTAFLFPGISVTGGRRKKVFYLHENLKYGHSIL